ncbi:hypothetical protein [Pandoraea anhela]|uniref:Uncharacterized protein n=1 Tax=Pandoraea anhela TaxID=2508295 RepID=A0A5E4T6Y0_9BURK|nr:hypothetical protein [Pandoraea anhela]VVD84006.1 hypothetical protein PAN31108_01265 [Pandoraea anhela]
MGISTSSLSLIGHTRSYLSPQTIETCITAGSKSEIRSLWERIKDWFLGTHTQAAKLALFELAHARSSQAQFDAFVELARYVDPAQFDRLQWCIDENDTLIFRIEDYAFSSRAEWVSPAPMVLPLPDMARLLLSLRHDDLPVVCRFREIGASRVYDQARLAAEGEVPKAVDFSADHVLAAQQWYLRSSPALFDALEIIGMHRNDDRGDMAFALNREVVQVLASTGIDDEDVINPVGRNAQTLMCLMTDAFHDREALKRAYAAANLAY